MRVREPCAISQLKEQLQASNDAREAMIVELARAKAEVHRMTLEQGTLLNMDVKAAHGLKRMLIGHKALSKAYSVSTKLGCCITSGKRISLLNDL